MSVKSIIRTMQNNLTSGLINGTTPPCEMTTLPRSLLSLREMLKQAIRKNGNAVLTLRRFGSQVGDDAARYVASCYRERRYRRVQEFQRRGIQGQLRGKLQSVKLLVSVHRIAENCRVEHTRSACTDTLGVVAALQETVDTTDGELKTGLRRTGLGLRGVTSLASGLASLSFARHCWCG